MQAENKIRKYFLLFLLFAKLLAAFLFISFLQGFLGLDFGKWNLIFNLLLYVLISFPAYLKDKNLAKTEVLLSTIAASMILAFCLSNTVFWKGWKAYQWRNKIIEAPTS